jgi:hypothetical protein
MSCSICGQKSMNCDCTELERNQNYQIERMESQLQELSDALERSVKLQSHYAELLNGYDGGRRLQFETADAWLLRLKEVDAKKPKPTD